MAIRIRTTDELVDSVGVSPLEPDYREDAIARLGWQLLSVGYDSHGEPVTWVFEDGQPKDPRSRNW